MFKILLLLIPFARLTVAVEPEIYPVQLFSLPLEVSQALQASEHAHTLGVSLHVNPFYLNGDFDGDGRADTAVLVRNLTTRKAGIAVVSGGDHSVVVLGAGKPFNGADDLNWMDAWQLHEKGPVQEGVEAGPPPTLKGDAILAIKSESASGLVYWNGEKYVWYQQSD